MDRNENLRSIENHRSGLAPLLAAYEDLAKAYQASHTNGIHSGLGSWIEKAHRLTRERWALIMLQERDQVTNFG
jgi:hypothetical protein